MNELTIEGLLKELGVSKSRLAEVLGISPQMLNHFRTNGIKEPKVEYINEMVAFYKKNGFPKPSAPKIPYLQREITYFPIQLPIIRISNPMAYKAAFVEGNKDLQDQFDIIPFPTNRIGRGSYFAFLFDRDEKMESGSIYDLPEDCLAMGREAKKDYRLERILGKNIIIFTGDDFISGTLYNFTEKELIIKKTSRPNMSIVQEIDKNTQVFEVIKKII